MSAQKEKSDYSLKVGRVHIESVTRNIERIQLSYDDNYGTCFEILTNV